MAAAKRSPEEIKASIEANRVELAHALQQLQGEFQQLTDWRAHLRNNRENVVRGALGAGFLLGGGLGGVVGLFRRKR